jgi:hypothetical protein
MKAEENGNDSILLCRKALLSPIKGLDEVEVHHLTVTVGLLAQEWPRQSLIDPTFPRRVVSDDDHKAWGLSKRNPNSDEPPIWTSSSPQLSRHDWKCY